MNSNLIYFTSASLLLILLTSGTLRRRMIAFFNTTNFSSLLHFFTFHFCLLNHLSSKLCLGCLHFGIGGMGVYFFGQLIQQTSMAFAR